MKIKKYLYSGAIVPLDNTRVLRPLIIRPIKRKLKPGEFFYNDHGTMRVGRHKDEQVSSDTRTERLRKSDLKYADLKTKLILMQKALELTALVANAVIEKTLPSYWVEQATGEKPSAIQSAIIDLGSPSLISKATLLGIKYVPRVMRVLNSPVTGEWTRFGNSMVRMKPGYAFSTGLGKPEIVAGVPEGWEIVRPLILNGKQTYLVKHPKYGFTSLEEANGTVGRGSWAQLVTNEALDAYNPALRTDPANKDLIDELRWIARRIDSNSGKETPAIISNTEGYDYPKLMHLLLRTQAGLREYPNGATMVFRGLWPGSSTIARSPNYDALFLGYNRDMAMPYVRIGSSLGGKNNFGIPQYEKYFSPEKVELLRDLDRQIAELINTKGYYNQEDAAKLLYLHNIRSTILGERMPEFGGLQLLLVPNNSKGEMMKITYPNGLAMLGSKFGDLGAGLPITIPKLAGDTYFYDANAVSGALASEGPAMDLYGVFLHSRSPEFTGIHDKGVGSTLIWNQDGFAPFLKSVHGSSFRNMSGSIESAYKKGGKLKKIIKNAK